MVHCWGSTVVKSTGLHYTSYYGVVMTCVIDTLNLDRTRAPIMEASCDVILAVLSEHAGPDYEPVESDGLW